MSINYQICARCVMDTTDPDIQFDATGICNHCRHHDALAKKHILGGDEGRKKLGEVVETIKRKGAGKKYDCVIGVSGGVDSTYVAFKVKEFGLRPLAVHLDNGWDSELAVKNIENVLKKLSIDLYTHVLDWEEFKDLQMAFLEASTPDSEIPTDHAINAVMRLTAKKTGVKYIVSGSNIKTETHLPRAWSQGHNDWKYIKSVHREFSKAKLKTFPHMGFWTHLKLCKTQVCLDILNYLDYVKKDAMKILELKLGWKYYGGKHYESIYTRFYQGYILPRKFGYDKRKAHLSSLICSGEITRENALDELNKETYPAEMQKEDRVYVIKKLGITEHKFEEIMCLPKKTYWDYPSYGNLCETNAYKSCFAVYRLLKRMGKYETN